MIDINKIHARKRKRTQIAKAVLIVFASALLLALTARNADYKRAIYDCEHSQRTSANMADDSHYTRLIGRQGKDYHNMPTKPKYRHFWDNY